EMNSMSEVKRRTAGIYAILILMLVVAFIWFIDGLLHLNIIEMTGLEVLFGAIFLGIRYIFLLLLGATLTVEFFIIMGYFMLVWGILNVLMAFLLVSTMANWARIATIGITVVGIIVAAISLGVFAGIISLIIAAYLSGSGHLFKQAE
ncbi:MAG: hypothetical protein ACFE7S_09425, partial [Candidatus Hodarchaeota archaeon]